MDELRRGVTALVLGAIVLAIVILWRTPEPWSHVAWAVHIERAYTIDGEDGYRVIRYDHENTDGVRVAHALVHSRLPRRVRLRAPPDQCDVWTRVRVPTGGDGTPFLRLVAHFVRDCAFLREGAVQTAILVGTRDRLEPRIRFSKRGSYVRAAFVHSEPVDDVHTTLRKCRKQIEAIRADPRLCDTYVERISTMRCHYIFNKWMLNRIERADGRVLKLHRGGHRVSLRYLLAVRVPLELKFVREADDPDVWSILASPLWLSFV